MHGYEQLTEVFQIYFHPRKDWDQKRLNQLTWRLLALREVQRVLHNMNGISQNTISQPTVVKCSAHGTFKNKHHHSPHVPVM